MSEQNKRHQQRQQRLKNSVDERIASAEQERGQLLVLTGNGKGKSSSAFGMVARSVGHGQSCAVAQYIKGTWACGERDLLEGHGVKFAVMATGFTWETQNRELDKQQALLIWKQCQQWLQDPQLYLLVFDELTYMLTYDYISVDDVVEALKARPLEQSVVITGRACHRKILELADTVSEVKNVKHGFDSGLKARKGIDW